MCGLAGFLDAQAQRTADELRCVGATMTATLAHRGPDDALVWADGAAGIVLGFRRLAIIDLTAAGRQPMESASGRYVLVFNGEVYNFAALRKELEGSGTAPIFRGHSDTEVMLAAIEAWGLENAVKRFIGMFAFALWDRRERVLHLVRDRLGVKPLYYGWVGGALLFGSELKALRAFPGFRGEIDRDALALFMRHGYIPAPHSVYNGAFKLPAGAILTAGAGQIAAIPKPYWSAKTVAEEGVAQPLTASTAEATEQLDLLLRDAIGLRMIADVPLGVFLSGGIDSSIVVALMQVQSSRPVRTFTIGFHEDGYNEAQYAKEVARHLGTDHTELYVTPEEAQAVIPRLPMLYDEPFADSSQIPTFLVSALARRHVTVSLSGDGGDELFGGYNRYFWAQDIWSRIRWVPRALRSGVSRALTALSPQTWDTVFERMAPLLPRRARLRNPGEKVSKLAEILEVDSPERLYWELVSQWKDPASVVLDACESPTALTRQGDWPNLGNFTQRMMYLDLITYLPDDILTKVDRASMGVSLEAREPLLDHRLVEFAWRLPLRLKVRRGEGKWILRQVLYRYVPRSLIERPKAGFGVPLDGWLRGPLREWAEALLDEGRLRREGFFDPAPIRAKWVEHLSGRRNFQHYLWDVLIFQSWYEQWGRSSCFTGSGRRAG
jgi:asparagine synthase (glutamine-hydrolysing)